MTSCWQTYFTKTTYFNIAALWLVETWRWAGLPACHTSFPPYTPSKEVMGLEGLGPQQPRNQKYIDNPPTMPFHLIPLVLQNVMYSLQSGVTDKRLQTNRECRHECEWSVPFLFHDGLTESQVPVVLHAIALQVLPSQAICWEPLYLPVLEAAVLDLALHSGIRPDIPTDAHWAKTNSTVSHVCYLCMDRDKQNHLFLQNYTPKWLKQTDIPGLCWV